MLILGINTVQDACEAALVSAGKIVRAHSEPMEQGHDTRLGPVVAEAMSGHRFDDLTRVAVIVGPGSFTGVRVGVSFARGLSLSLDIPAVGVTSLESLGGLPRDRRVLALLPAKRRPPERTWWAQILEHGAGASPPFEAVEETLAELAKTVDVVCGGLDSAPNLGAERIIASPSAAAAAIFAERLGDGDLPAPRPVYVREPDAKPQINPVRRP
ncbi:MAG TPA: tRNA (adenosine(37)-N6)-threonylcarbamoyltransferase complex dimerization subunit type 1 TsaB [Hyphomonadaceae bacterium]|nr:tRNA (adenosine(37)-N6)-threonylcarbamoyltransferase complex dimerization subunit type 1 TsaB [Hyphomonadaceae bacterium]